MYMSGQWSLTSLTVVFIEEVVTAMQVLAIQLPFVATAIRLTATISSASASLCTSSKILRALDARAKFHIEI